MAKKAIHTAQNMVWPGECRVQQSAKMPNQGCESVCERKSEIM